MKKFKTAWKKFSDSDLMDNLKVYFGIFVVFSLIFFPLMHGLSSIEFFAPFTEPIAKIGLYIGAFAVGIYFLVLGLLFLFWLFERTKELPDTLSDFFSSRDQIRAAIAWAVGILISVALIFSLFTLLYTWGIIDPSSDSEEKSFILSAGGAALIFSLMIGARCGMAIYKKNIRGGVTDKGEIEFKACLIGIVSFGFLASIIDLAFGYEGANPWLAEISNLAIVGILFAILKPWHDVKISRLSKKITSQKTDENLVSQIFINLMIVAILAVCLGLLAAGAWLGFTILNYVENEFYKLFLIFLAFIAFVTLTIVGGSLAWKFFTELLIGKPRALSAKADLMYKHPAPSKILTEPIETLGQLRLSKIKGASLLLKSDCDHISQWFLSKLNEGSATSALMIVTVGEESDAHSFGLNTVKEAVEMAHTYLISNYKNATRYVVAYDAGWYNASGIEQRAIYVEAEEQSTATPRLFVYRILPTTGAPFSFTNEVFEFKPPEWSLYKPNTPPTEQGHSIRS